MELELPSSKGWKDRTRIEKHGEFDSYRIEKRTGRDVPGKTERPVPIGLANPEQKQKGV